MSELKISVISSKTGAVTLGHAGITYELYKISSMMTSKSHVDPVQSLLNSVAALTADQWSRGASNVYLIVLSDRAYAGDLKDLVEVTYKERKAGEVIVVPEVKEIRDAEPDGDETFAVLHYAVFATHPRGDVFTSPDGEKWVKPQIVPGMSPSIPDDALNQP